MLYRIYFIFLQEKKLRRIDSLGGIWNQVYVGLDLTIQEYASLHSAHQPISHAFNTHSYKLCPFYAVP